MGALAPTCSRQGLQAPPLGLSWYSSQLGMLLQPYTLTLLPSPWGWVLSFPLSLWIKEHHPSLRKCLCQPPSVNNLSSALPLLLVPLNNHWPCQAC